MWHGQVVSEPSNILEKHLVAKDFGGGIGPVLGRTGIVTSLTDLVIPGGPSMLPTRIQRSKYKAPVVFGCGVIRR